jgi:hypothetical protein
MVWVADDLATWLLEQLADASRRKLTGLVLGDELQRALRRAATAAVQATAAELSPGDAERSAYLAMSIGEVFAAVVPESADARTTVLERLRAGITGQLAVLEDPALTGTGQSWAEAAAVPAAAIAPRLTAHLLSEIVSGAAHGGPLFPLAAQLNADVIQLQGQQTHDTLHQLGAEILEAIARVGHQPRDVGLPSELDRPAVAFLVNFETYLDHAGDMKDQLALLPNGIWPLIDTQSHGLSEAFIGSHHLQRTDLVTKNGIELGETLAFLLKVAWQRGYLMYKFRQFGHIPLPAGSVDPGAIMDALVADGDPAHPNLAAGIEVILQRAVSLGTKPEPVRKSLQMIDASLAQKCERFLDDWRAVVRSAHGWGILSAKAEGRLTGPR